MVTFQFKTWIFLQKKKSTNAFQLELINSFINNMFDTDIHLSTTLLNEYFLAILQYFLEHLAFGTFARVSYNILYLKYHKNGKSITSIEGVYIYSNMQ